MHKPLWPSDLGLGPRSRKPAKCDHAEPSFRRCASVKRTPHSVELLNQQRWMLKWPDCRPRRRTTNAPPSCNHCLWKVSVVMRGVESQLYEHMHGCELFLRINRCHRCFKNALKTSPSRRTCRTSVVLRLWPTRPSPKASRNQSMSLVGGSTSIGPNGYGNEAHNMHIYDDSDHPACPTPDGKPKRSRPL